MIKRLGKMAVITAMCSVLMLGSSMTVFAGGGEEVETPITEPIYTEVKPTEEPEEIKEPVAFTPDGNAQLVDEATNEDEKLFYTFVTKNDNYFYLVIDKAREQDNVYMLNMIDEEDLKALIEEQDSANTTVSGASQNEVTLKPEAGVTEETEPDTTEPESPDKEGKDKQTGNGSASSILIVLLVLAGGGAGVFYYLKFIKGKKEDFQMEDDLDFYDDEEYENEDEVLEDESIDENEDADTVEDSEETGEIEEDI